MRLSAIAFTGKGSRLCVRLCALLQSRGHEACAYISQKYAGGFPQAKTVPGTAAGWTAEHFAADDGLIFIGAAGIAVRLIAPCLGDKFTDPAVVVLDDEGCHAISLLSGHVGGANRLTEEIAALVGADPVITTATDLRKKTAVDVWAKRYGLALPDRTLAKRAAQAAADGGRVGVFLDGELSPLFEDAARALCSDADTYVRDRRCEVNVRITVRTGDGDADTLRALPRALILGVGCRKGTPQKTVGEAVSAALAAQGLDMAAAAAVASVDLKKEEPGLLAFAASLGVPFFTFSAQELAGVPGSFSGSEFVRRVTGVDNVCERAAAAGALLSGAFAAEENRPVLVMNKTAADGVTAAAALARLKTAEAEETT